MSKMLRTILVLGIMVLGLVATAAAMGEKVDDPILESMPKGPRPRWTMGRAADKDFFYAPGSAQYRKTSEASARSAAITAARAELVRLVQADIVASIQSADVEGGADNDGRDIRAQHYAETVMKERSVGTLANASIAEAYFEKRYRKAEGPNDPYINYYVLVRVPQEDVKRYQQGVIRDARNQALQNNNRLAVEALDKVRTHWDNE